jgi:hypothetical protein
VLATIAEPRCFQVSNDYFVPIITCQIDCGNMPGPNLPEIGRGLYKVDFVGMPGSAGARSESR